MTEEIERLRALLAKATPGDWRLSPSHASVRAGTTRIAHSHDGGPKAASVDYPLIVMMKNRLPDLLARIDALTAERDGLRAVISDPVAVHANMLRGTIAKPSVVDIMHIYTGKLVEVECATAAEAECARLVHVIERIRHIDDHAHVRPNEKSAREEMGHIARAALEAPRG